MKRLTPGLRGGAALALAIFAAACSTAPRPQLAAAPLQSNSRDEVETIAALLDQGDRSQAKKRLNSALKRDPRNANLMMLHDSLVRDPIELLGPAHFAYTVQQGETISGIAQRLLGNRLKSYQLARYNGIEGSPSLTVGQVLRIPGQAPRTEPVKRIAPRAEAQSEVAKPKPVPVPAPRTASATPHSAQPRASVTAARQARAAGLSALNEGKPARAVGLLARAAALDPGNPAITRDLERAQRINATVMAR